jgi:hypothetical protein
VIYCLRSNQPINKPGLPNDCNQCNKWLEHEVRKSINNVRWVKAFNAGEVNGKSSGDDGADRAPKLANAKTKQNGNAVRI